MPSPSALLVCLALAAAALAQTRTPAEKLEARMRVEYVKATKHIKVPTIKAAELAKIIDDTNLVLLDIRQPGEQMISMLPHALGLIGFATKYKKGIPAGKRLVVYCTIGYRSGKYAEQLAAQGIKSENLEGGVLAWSFVGGDFWTVDSTKTRVKTKTVHVYDQSWNFLHPDYKAVW